MLTPTTSVNLFYTASSSIVSSDVLALFYDILVVATITGIIAGLVARVMWWVFR